MELCYISYNISKTYRSYDRNRSHYSVKLDCIAIGDFIIIDFIIFIDSTIRDLKMVKMVNMDSKHESKNNQWYFILVDKF